MLVQNSTQFMHSFEASQKKRQESQERENFQRENNSSSSASLVEHSSSILTQVATFLPNSLFKSAIYVRWTRSWDAVWMRS